MGVSEPEQLNAIEGYDSFFKSIQQVAFDINAIAFENSNEEQVRKSLKYLFDANREDNTELINFIKQVIHSRLYINWNLSNQERYNVGVQLILDWIHFFISYTNASRPDVNYDYYALLKNSFQSSFIKCNKEKMNLVAALLYKYFKTQRLKCFYDKDELDWSDDFRKKIFSFSSRAFAFVQLVETEMFEKPEIDNYCYQEYKSYCSSINTLSKKYNIQNLNPFCFYIVSNPANFEPYDFKPAALPKSYEAWASDITSKQVFILNRKMTAAELKLQVQNAAKKILDARNRIFEQYLNTF
jgi:hypothetical protein